MKTRSELSAAEIDEMHHALEGRLHKVGIETQPEVAARIVALVTDADAGLRQYAEVVRADAALSGRMLRLANSAYFAQRQPVTSLDRACVLLGLERLKAISLGFHLSRAAGANGRHPLSRKIWGEGVYRACLCAELSRTICPGYASEAFVIGLMMDCGVPLLARLIGADAMAIVGSDAPPLKQFKQEFERLPFTHVDIAVSLARRWRLPELLGKPIERHHTTPAPGGKPEPVHLLHRLAYYVGAIQLEASCTPKHAAPLALTAEKVLGITHADLVEAVTRAGAEYSAMSELFREVAQSIGNVQELTDCVQGQLIEIMDGSMMEQFREQTRTAVGTFHHRPAARGCADGARRRGRRVPGGPRGQPPGVLYLPPGQRTDHHHPRGPGAG
jgi:HD-like signal output (HDOD) protein